MNNTCWLRLFLSNASNTNEPFYANEDDIREAIKVFIGNSVRRILIARKTTGLSSGFVWVCFDNENDAQMAKGKQFPIKIDLIGKFDSD